MPSGTAGQFLSGLFEAGRERADKARAQMEQQRNDEIAMYREAAKTALQQGDTARASIAMKKIDELYKLPKGQSPFGKLGEFLQKVGKKHEEGEAGTGTGQASPGAADPNTVGIGAGGIEGPGGYTGVRNLPSLTGPPQGQGNQPNQPAQGGQPGAGQPAQPAQPGATGAPGKQTGGMVTRAFQKVARGLGTGISEVANTLSPQPPSLPPLDISAFPKGGGREHKVTQYVDETDHKMHIVMQRADNSTYEIDSTGKVLQSGSKFPRLTPPISMNEAQAQGAMGTQYPGMDGNPIDLSRYNNSWQLVGVYQNGDVRWLPTSQGINEVTIGNVKYAIPKLDAMNAANEAVPLGPSRTTSTNTPPIIGVDENNQVVRVPGTRVPASPGINQPGQSQPQPAQLPPLAGGQSGKATPSRSTSPTHQRVATDPGTPGSKTTASPKKSLPIPITLWNQQQNIARPVREGATQVFGDPSQPSLRSLKDYADIADNPEARARLAEAFNITFNDWDQEIKASGGLTHLIETAGGYPQLLAQLQANVREDAIGKLGSDIEKDYYDSVMSSYGAIVGLRSLTKASAASFSVTAIERELPLVGLNSFSTRQYYDQLARLSEQVYNGTRTLVDQVMPASEKQYYKSQVDALTKMKNQSKSEPGTGQSNSNLPALSSDPAGLYADH